MPPPVTVLVVSTPIPAHTLNATRLVRALVEAGHRVLWDTSAAYAAHARRCGAEPVVQGQPPAAIAWCSPGGLRGLAHVRALYRDEIAGRARAQVDRLVPLARREGVDVVLADTLAPAAGVVADLLGLPWATLGDGPLLWWDESTPPFGTGLRPMRGRAGRHRNRTVQRALDRWLYAEAAAELGRVRRERGLPPVATVREACLSPYLHLQGCSPSLEYPRDPMPAHVRFVGVLGPGPGHAPPLPDRLRRHRRTRPLALVTQGTMRPDEAELARPACRALVAEGYDVVVAGAATARDDGRVVAMRQVDYEDALAEADLLVTNGGWTGTTLALAAGVPVLQCGASEEKPDIGARVAWAGAGVSIPLTSPPVPLLRLGVRRATSPRCRRGARRIAVECAALDAGALGRDLLVDLARSRTVSPDRER